MATNSHLWQPGWTQTLCGISRRQWFKVALNPFKATCEACRKALEV